MTVADGLLRPEFRGRSVRFQGRAAQALECGRLRLMITGVCFAILFLAVAARLVDVTVLAPGGEPPAAPVAVAATATGTRADIVDRNGVVLATSLPTASLYGDPAMVLDPVLAAERLSEVLPDIDRAGVATALSTGRRFVWLKRDLTPREQYEVNRLGIPGLGFQTEQRRIYPLGALTAHVVGFTDVDGNGLAGIERQFNHALTAGSAPIRLSIDVRLQEIMRRELQAAVDEFQAIGAAGLIMDAHTGEVLAMVSLPDFDPDEAGSMPPDQRFNRCTLGVYEMGSTFKIFTSAMALDDGATTLATSYDASQPIHIGRYTINDYHAERRRLTVPEIFMVSSNIGAVQMALAAGTEAQQEFLARVGLTRPSPIELPEVGAPIVPDPWREVNTMTISFGHGIAVSPMQVVSATAAVLTGRLVPPTLLKLAPDQVPAGEPVVSDQTAHAMRQLMRLVVEHGTGTSAAAPGYLVGGKTGTAEKAGAHGYQRHALLSSFVGAFPINDPQYVVFVMLDEPKGDQRTFGYATAGWVAAPAISHIIQQMGPMLGIAPIDENRPDIVQALYVPVPGIAPPQAMAAQLASYENQ